MVLEFNGDRFLAVLNLILHWYFLVFWVFGFVLSITVSIGFVFAMSIISMVAVAMIILLLTHFLNRPFAVLLTK